MTITWHLNTHATIAICTVVCMCSYEFESFENLENKEEIDFLQRSSDIHPF